MSREGFEKELQHLINRYSMENGSDTPDFILAAYLVKCLEAFNATSRHREKWYGKELSIGVPQVLEPPPAVKREWEKGEAK